MRLVPLIVMGALALSAPAWAQEDAGVEVVKTTTAIMTFGTGDGSSNEVDILAGAPLSGVQTSLGIRYGRRFGSLITGRVSVKSGGGTDPTTHATLSSTALGLSVVTPGTFYGGGGLGVTHTLVSSATGTSAPSSGDIFVIGGARWALAPFLLGAEGHYVLGQGVSAEAYGGFTF